MAPKKTNPAHQFFVFDKETNISKCSIGNCNTSLTGDHGKNQEKHIFSKHPEESIIITKLRLEATRANGVNSRTTNDIDLPPRKKIKSASVAIDMQTIQTGCLEMVTINGRPFSAIDDSGFRKILDPCLRALQKSDPNINMSTINCHNVRDLVVQKALHVRESLKKELQGQLVSLKFDSATRLDRSILGVNVQFCSKGQIQLRTLSMKEFTMRHTSDNIKNAIMNSLSTYGLVLQNVYTITTDNANNVVKVSKLLGDTDASTKFTRKSVFDANMAPFDEDLEGYDEWNEELTEITSETSFTNIIDDIATSLMPQSELNVEGIRCAAHTLQLAIDDAIKKAELSDVIASTRKLVKKLRVPTTGLLLKNENKCKPLLDCPTRWHSTFDMIESLLALRQFCEKLSETDQSYFISSNTWTDIQKIHDSLKPAKIAAKKFQSEQLTPGDFFAIWFNCKTETKKKSVESNDLADLVASAMKIREDFLFKRDAFVTAVFLDPRYRLVLSEESCQRAVRTIMLIGDRIISLQTTPATNDVARSTSVPDPSDAIIEERDELENFLRDKECNVSAIGSSISMDLSEQLRLYTSYPRTPKTENVIEYWWNKRCVLPELSKIGFVVNSSPTTQVSVERNFSQLKFILSPQRANLTPEILDDILTIRTNHIFQN